MRKSSKVRTSQPNDGAGRRLSRRAMVQQLLVGASVGYAAPALAGPDPGAARPKPATRTSPASETPWKPLFLDPHQAETLGVLAERIVPGSTEAQVNRFIDLLLSVDTQENQRKFIDSLSAFEAEAIQRYGQPFLSLTQVEQNQILTAASAGESGAMRPKEPQSHRRGLHELGTAFPPQGRPATLFDHFVNLKTWIVGAYYSSEVGMKDLGWTGQVFFTSYPGCGQS